MSASSAQPLVSSDQSQSPFIVQRNPGTLHSDRVSRLNGRAESGRRYEVLERISHQWSLVTVLTVIDGGRRR